jgi:uncharacterized circularly permuted ATP-grasp superfamily protein/uncharacterized alpha-E superfamily protein
MLQQTPLLTEDLPDPVSLAYRAAQRGSLGHHNELFACLTQATGRRDPMALPWQRFFEANGTEGWLDLEQRLQRVKHRVRDDGATYNVYDEGNESARTWPLEVLPMIVDAQEWAAIERGVQQRVRLMNATLADVYGERTLLDKGLLPPSLVLGHPQYLRAMHGVVPPGGVHLHVAAFDLERGPDGGWWLLGQRTQAPSGLGYLLENRLIISQQFPEAFRDLRVQRVASAFQRWVQGLLRLSPAGDRSRVVLMTPGPHSETYFEHVFLARYLGLTLVEGADLTVRANKVFLKSLHGLEPVHVIVRRVDDDYLDPLELRADSALGVPGLLQALRCGEVVLANAPGAGWLESPGLSGFWPGVAKHLLDEDLLLPAATSWWCGERAVWERLRGQLADHVVAPTFPSSETTKGFNPRVVADLSESGRRSLIAGIEQNPAAYTLQTRVRPSETPVWVAGRLEPRVAVLRVFAMSDGQGGWHVLPGGLTRVSDQREGKRDPWLSMQHGSASADTWVLTNDRVDTTSLLPKPLSALDLGNWHRSVSSRSAESLFWLGRYTERAENTVRLARLMLEALTGSMVTGATPEVMHTLDLLARHHGLVGEGVPSPEQSLRVFERALVHALGDVKGSFSLAHQLAALQRNALALRERLSPEHWKLIQEVGDHFGQHLQAVVSSGLSESASDVLGLLNRAGTHLAAITGAQTDRMTRDDGWRLLSVGRQIERLGFLSHVLGTGFEQGLHEIDEGFNLMLGLFDSTITYRAQFQARREVLPLLHLLVHDTDNPRSLAWVARTMRDRFIKLSRQEAAWAAQVASSLPRPEDWPLRRIGSPDAKGLYSNLAELLELCGDQAYALSNAMGRRFFAHVGAADRMVWQ